MAILTESIRDGEFILSEANGTRSREVVTIDSKATAMQSGTAVGVISATGTYAKYDNAATDGTEVCRGVLYTSVKYTGTSQKAVVVKRDAEISFERTTGIDSNAQVDLLAIGVVVRGPTSPFTAPAPVAPPTN